MNAHLIHPDTFELAEILERQWPEFTHEPGTIVNESAGGAPAAAAEGGEGGEGESEEGGEETQPVTRADLGAFEQRFDQLTENMAAMLQGQQGGEPQGGDFGQEYGQQEGQRQEADYGQMAEELMQQAEQTGEINPQQLRELIQAESMQTAQKLVQQVLPQAIEQAVGPIHDRFIGQEADEIENTYPALKDPDTQRSVLQEALLRAQQFGQDQNFVRQNPRFVEETWLLRCAREGIPAKPAGGEEAALEGATGQGGGGQEEPNLAAEIVGAGGSDGDVFRGAFG